MRREGSNRGTCIQSIILHPRVVIPRSSLSLSLFSGVELTRAIVGGELQGEKGDPEKRLCGISRGLMGGVENNGRGTERERESSGALWLHSRGRVAATHIKLIKVGGTQGVVYCTSPLGSRRRRSGGAVGGPHCSVFTPALSFLPSSFPFPSSFLPAILRPFPLRATSQPRRVPRWSLKWRVQTSPC